jgi:hypothetical protein
MSRPLSLLWSGMHGASDPKAPGVFDAAAVIEVERHLRSREAFKKVGIAAGLAFGLPALLFGPIVLSSIYWVIGLMWDMYVPWTDVFGGSLILLVPLLFWTEWRNGGSYYSEAILAVNDPADRDTIPSLGMDDVDLVVGFGTNPRAVSLTLVELFLWGPRQVLEAVRMLRCMGRLRRVDRSRAAALLGGLLRIPGHIELKQLIAGTNATDGVAVAYLVWYGWIGISADADRVWIESESRNILAQ